MIRPIHIFAFSLGLALILFGCAHRQPETPAQVLQAPPAQAATSTAAQSAEIAPLVITATGAGIAAVGVGVLLKDPHLAVAGAATSVGALALQRFLPWIPWLIAAAAVYLAIRYAIKHHIGSRLWAKDRTKLKQVYAQVSGAAIDASKAPGVTFDSISEDLAKHLQ